MNQSPTLRGTLIQLRKYYQIFYTLNVNKDDYSFLGYPFAGAYSEKQSTDQYNLGLFYVGELNRNYTQATLESIHNLVCRCFADNTEYELVKYMFYLKKNNATRTDPFGECTPDPSTFAATELAEKIMHHKRFFTNRFNKDFPSTTVWAPNA